MERFPQDRRTYAEAMLKTQLASAALPLGCYWPLLSLHPLEERIAMLNKPRPSRSWRIAGAALIGALWLGTAYATATTDGVQRATVEAASASTGLTMRLVDDAPGAANRVGNEHVTSPDGALWLAPEVVLTGDMVASAMPTTDPDGHAVVRFQLTPEGRTRFAAVTNANVGRRLAIIVNGTVMSVPVIREEISGGGGQISAQGWGIAEAEQVAAAISPLQR
jgi:hypothetical protein